MISLTQFLLFVIILVILLLFLLILRIYFYDRERPDHAIEDTNKKIDALSGGIKGDMDGLKNKMGGLPGIDGKADQILQSLKKLENLPQTITGMAKAGEGKISDLQKKVAKEEKEKTTLQDTLAGMKTAIEQIGIHLDEMEPAKEKSLKELGGIVQQLGAELAEIRKQVNLLHLNAQGKSEISVMIDELEKE